MSIGGPTQREPHQKIAFEAAQRVADKKRPGFILIVELVDDVQAAAHLVSGRQPRDALAFNEMVAGGMVALADLWRQAHKPTELRSGGE